MSLTTRYVKAWQFIVFVGSKEFNKKKSKLPLGSSATSFNFKQNQYAIFFHSKNKFN
jgi:hypothetical protein